MKAILGHYAEDVKNRKSPRMLNNFLAKLISWRCTIYWLVACVLVVGTVVFLSVYGIVTDCTPTILLFAMGEVSCLSVDIDRGFSYVLACYSVDYN